MSVRTVIDVTYFKVRGTAKSRSTTCTQFFVHVDDQYAVSGPVIFVSASPNLRSNLAQVMCHATGVHNSLARLRPAPGVFAKKGSAEASCKKGFLPRMVAGPENQHEHGRGEAWGRQHLDPRDRPASGRRI